MTGGWWGKFFNFKVGIYSGKGKGGKNEECGGGDLN